MSKSCIPHNNPTNWKYEPAPERGYGFQRVTCSVCGVFVGYKPPPVEKKPRGKK